MSTIDELRASGIAVDLDTVQMLCEHYMPQPYGTILLNNTKHEHLLSLLKSKQAKEQANLAALQQKESLVTELKDNSQPSKGQDDATLGAISNFATEQAHCLTKANAPTITNYPAKSDAQPSLGHSVFSVTNLVADDYIASMALETNTLYASLNTKMELIQEHHTLMPWPTTTMIVLNPLITATVTALTSTPTLNQQQQKQQHKQLQHQQQETHKQPA